MSTPKTTPIDVNRVKEDSPKPLSRPAPSVTFAEKLASAAKALSEATDPAPDQKDVDEARRRLELQLVKSVLGMAKPAKLDRVEVSGMDDDA